MYNIILDWLGISGLNVSSDILCLIVCIVSFIFLEFVLDIFKMIYYSISKR